VLLQQKRFDEGIVALRTAVQKEPGNVFSVAALIYGLGDAGQKKEARRHLDQLLKKYEYVPYWFLAMAWVGLDEKERALQALEGFPQSRTLHGELAGGCHLRSAARGRPL